MRENSAMNETSKLFASLKAIGIDPKMASFGERKRVQKMVYLLEKVFGVNFSFSYSWYLHGPYSPQLTEKMYDVIERGQRVDSNPENLTTDDLSKIAKLKAFLKEDIDSNDELELLVSVHYLLNCSSGKSKIQNVVEFMKKRKPYFNTSEVYKAIERMKPLMEE